MRAHNQGGDILLVFDKDLGAALGKACEGDSDSDAVALARAAQIVRQQMFETQNSLMVHLERTTSRSQCQNYYLGW